MEAVTGDKDVIMALENVGENVSVHHREWFTTVKQICDNVAVEPALPRLCTHQNNRSHIPAENACKYYWRVISVPLIILSQSLNYSLTNTSKLLYKGCISYLHCL